MEMTVDMFPVIGEPRAVELANTLYVRPGSTVDFLDRSDWIVTWLGLAVSDSALTLPKRIDQAGGADLRSIRDAVRDLLSTATQRNGQPDPSGVATLSVATLNRFTDAPRVRYRLEWAADSPPRSAIVPTGRGLAAVLTHLAIESVSFLGSGDVARVRRCDGPDCPMLFVQQHHKRRFCHDGCAHRARQARYYQHHRSSVAGIRS